MQLRSDKAFLSTRRLAIEFDDKRNNSRKAFRKVFAYTRFDKIMGIDHVFLLLGKMINTARDESNINRTGRLAGLLPKEWRRCTMSAEFR